MRGGEEAQLRPKRGKKRFQREKAFYRHHVLYINALKKDKGSMSKKFVWKTLKGFLVLIVLSRKSSFFPSSK